MTDINASAPVVVPASNSVTYDKWYLTQLVGKVGLTSAPFSVRLQRAAKNGSTWTLMPLSDPNAEVTINLDMFAEMTSTPEIAAAMDAVNAAVVVYATKKNLI